MAIITEVAKQYLLAFATENIPYITVAIIVSHIHLRDNPESISCLFAGTVKYLYAIHITIEINVENVLLLKISIQSIICISLPD